MSLLTRTILCLCMNYLPDDLDDQTRDENSCQHEDANNNVFQSWEMRH